MSKNGGIVVTDKRLKFDTGGAEGSSGLAIKDAAQKAEAVLDTRTNSLRDDATAVPLGDRVNVKRIAEAEYSAHGIVVPDTGKTPAAFGVVVGVGQGRYNLVGQLIPIRVQVGAVVMFGKYAGTDLPLFGVASRSAEPLLCLREEEIMQVIMSHEDYEKMRAAADPEIVGVGKYKKWFNGELQPTGPLTRNGQTASQTYDEAARVIVVADPEIVKSPI